VFTHNYVGNTRYQVRCAVGTDAGNGPVCRTDNGAVSVWLQSTASGNAAARQAILDTLNLSYDKTSALTVSYPSSPSYNSGADTDIIYQGGSIAAGAGYDGYTWCSEPQTSNIYGCDQQYVKVRTSSGVDRQLACHETGHAVGLLHGDDADPYKDPSSPQLECMKNPRDASHYGLGETNTYWINWMY
jgi:hypothetical protein